MTTMLTTGEPNSPNALRIIQLMEDAVVGSFSISNNQSSLGEDRRTFTVHKMINQITPPTTFKFQIEFERGLTQEIPTMDSPLQALPAAHIQTKAVADLPLNIVLLDNDEDTLFQIEEIFPKHNNISIYTTEEDFAMHLYGLDCDLLLLNANQTTLNWRQILALLRDAYPTMPMFLYTDGRQGQMTYQAAIQVGANGLFFKPLVPNDIRKAFEKAVKEYGTMEELIEKRGAVLEPQSLPEDFIDPVIGSISGIKYEDINLIGFADFKDKIMMQIWKYNKQQTSFNLISFKMVYLKPAGNLSNLPQGMELVRRVGITVINSLRSLNDAACRHMDKIVVLLENSTNEGAISFAKRVVADLNNSLSVELNLQPNRHFHILTAVTAYPDDADNVNDLMSQVTDVSRNLVRTF
ncbi:MAG: hypothetical protein P9M15_07815 [Candidatus Electryoneaceae bacterium]|nr:hypothetical protein [Candidatus Electryoneaceae bacterium]